MYTSPDSLQGKLLIAQPATQSNFFNESVILMCEHHAKGAWGLVVNKPSDNITLATVAQGMEVGIYGNERVYQGGPVQTDGLHFIHTPDVSVADTFSVTPGLCVTSSEAMLREIAQDRGPANWRLCIGVATWQAGQLEGEMSGERPWTPQHKWLTTSCPVNLLEIPIHRIWKEATSESISDSVKNLF